MFLEKELTDFVDNYNKNILSNMYNKNNKSIKEMSVQNKIHRLQQVTLPSFNTNLNEIGSYITSLIEPNVKDYKNWNIDQMIQWISLLENGRYMKYIDILRKGFLNDGINSGDILSDITRNDLRAQPFNIEGFTDRRDLENHFKSLKSQQRQSQNNEEGAITEYL